ncbi:dihydropteroate synthase [bacterium 336/3]|nr:dihydropteroate synthase [bacterium 336/3]
MFTINCKGRLITLEKPLIMGILNITPDSFYDGGKYLSENDILEQAEKLILQGADILDIGGYSTRPNAQEVSEKEEINRVIPAIQMIKKHFPATILSIDTFRADVAKEAIENGADIINDISGGQLDDKMFEIVANLQVPYILMHSRGNPQTMNQLTHYENILLEILHFFEKRIQKLHILGVKDIILDLGFGFAKTKEQNFYLLKHLSYFKTLNLPLLVGISRKSMIYKTLDVTPEQSLNGTSVLNTFALSQGAHILRVHDVKEVNEAKILHNLLI